MRERKQTRTCQYTDLNTCTVYYSFFRTPLIRIPHIMDEIPWKQLFFSLFALINPNVCLVFRTLFWPEIDRKSVKYRAKDSGFNGVKINWIR